MSTDPLSSDFDPMLAIYSESSDPSPEGVTIYDNIAVFEGSLRRQEMGLPQDEPGSSQKSSSKSFSQKKKVQEEAKNRDVSKLKELMEMRKQMDLADDPKAEEKWKQKEKSQKPKSRKTLLTSMEKLSKGPFSILYRIVKDHIRCNIYVRDFCGLRGVCTGYIVAYDRFMNLAMIDIDETFRKPPLGKVAEHQKSLSVTMLNEAMKTLSTGKSQVKVISSKSNVQHRTTSGVQTHSRPQKSYVEHRTTSGVQVLARNSRHSNRGQESSEREGTVKEVGKEFFKGEVFHGGTPQLYHRHLDQLLVRGDGIVLISTKK